MRRVDLEGIITTVAGSGTQGFSGDGGPATAARLSSPSGLALDSAGSLLYIADTGGPGWQPQLGRIESLAGAAGA